MTITASLSPVVKYHGLARRYLTAPRFLMRPLVNGGTLDKAAARRVWREGGDVARVVAFLRETSALVGETFVQ